MSNRTLLLLSIALTIASVIWFLDQRNTQTTATESPSDLNTSGAGSP